MTPDRRVFLKSAAGAGALLAARANPLLAFSGSPNDKVVVAVAGVNGRGDVHLQNFAASPNAEVAYVCDVDQRAMTKGVETVAKIQARRPRGIGDFRRALDDKDVDAIVIAAPDHWHASETLMALAAG